MKGKKASGGSTGGDDEAEKDIKDKPEDRTNASKIAAEAEEMKKGGKAKRKSGGKVEGMKPKIHGGKMPRASGGRTGSNMNPLSSAHSGSPAPGRKEMSESMD